MIKTFKFGFLFLALFFVLQSCRKDEDEDKNAANTQTYYNGFIQVDNNAKFRIAIALAQGSKETGLNGTNSYQFSFGAVEEAGTKNVVLNIKFPSTLNINGTYSIGNPVRELDDFGTSYTEGNFTGSQNYDDLSVGTFTITRNSTTNFTVSFKLNLKDGRIVKGEFSDNLPINEITL